MPKLPKMSELASPGVLNKFKSMLATLTGPATTEETEASLAEEKDPHKRQLLEIEFLINQLQDIHMIQERTLKALQVKFKEAQTRLLSTSELKSEETEPVEPTNPPDETQNK